MKIRIVWNFGEQIEKRAGSLTSVLKRIKELEKSWWEVFRVEALKERTINWETTYTTKWVVYRKNKSERKEADIDSK